MKFKHRFEYYYVLWTPKCEYLLWVKWWKIHFASNPSTSMTIFWIHVADAIASKVINRIHRGFHWTCNIQIHRAWLWHLHLVSTTWLNRIDLSRCLTLAFLLLNVERKICILFGRENYMCGYIRSIRRDAYLFSGLIISRIRFAIMAKCLTNSVQFIYILLPRAASIPFDNKSFIHSSNAYAFYLVASHAWHNGFEYQS